MTDRTGLASLVPVTPMQNVPFWRQTVLLYGPPKIGKTTFASKYPNAIFFDAEQGTVGIDVPTFENLIGRDRFNSPISDWADVLAATSQLEGTRGKGIDGVIVVDTGQAAFDMCRNYVKERQGWEHESDVGYGKAWNAVKQEFNQWIMRIKGLGFGLVFIGHETSELIEEPTRSYEKTKPRLATGPRDIIEPFVNLILHAESMHVRGQECRVIRTKGTTETTAGERGENPRLQELLPFDYDAVNRNWNGEVIDLNVWFGFAPPPDNQSGVGGARPDHATPPINNADPGVASVAQTFDATLATN